MKLTRFVYNSIDSTNLEARRYWDRAEIRREAVASQRDGKRAAWAFTAGEQTAGRGRLGRSWRSPFGGLWFSLLWPIEIDPPRLQGIPLTAGLAVADAIEQETHVGCMIKWPNDLLVREKKLGGVLCDLEVRAKTAALIVGVGINGNFAPEQVAAGASYPVTSLLEQTGRPVDLEALLDKALHGLLKNLAEFETAGLTRFLPAVHQRLAWIDTPVFLGGSEAGDKRGVLKGVDAVGRVVLDCDGEVRSFMTGELRPGRASVTV